MVYAAIVVSLVELALLIGAVYLAMLALWHVSRICTRQSTGVLVLRVEAAYEREADRRPNEAEFAFAQYCTLGGL